jgi:hypothetical protein
MTTSVFSEQIYLHMDIYFRKNIVKRRFIMQKKMRMESFFDLKQTLIESWALYFSLLFSGVH